MAFDLYPAVDEDYKFPQAVREANALTPEFRNQVVPMTETQRNNLTGDELWTNRLIFNTTAVRINRYDGTDWVNLQIEPPGIIKMDAGATPPDNHYACKGDVIVRTGVNAALFARIGTQYNTGGEASTHFRLPNLTGRVAVGLDAGDPNMNALGDSGGEKTHALTTGEMPSHGHTAGTATDGGVDHLHNNSISDGAGNHAHHQYTYSDGVADLASGSGRAREGFSDPGRLTDGAGGHNHTINNGGSDRSLAHAHAVTVNANGGGGAHNNLQPYLAVNYIITI